MNERIIKIGLESGMLNYVDNETPRHYFLSGHADEQDLAKFAELIVQECAQACMNEGASYEEKAAGAYQSNLYVTAIKQHFGFEEQSTKPNGLHTCPYAEEIHNDYETLCDCDEEQQRQCAADI